MKRRVWQVSPLALLYVLLTAVPAFAQDLEPRAYSASPVGLNFLVAGYNWLTGQVVSDPALPFSDVHARVQTPVLGAGHSFNFFGKLALVTAVLPYSVAHVTGKVFEQNAEARRSGLGDARFKFSTNFIGNPALAPRAFMAAPRRTIVGASLLVTAPIGQYDGTKLINLGANRWAFKPEIGVSFPKGPWSLDGYVGALFFTANDDFYPGGARRTQEPVLTIQGHGSYEFRPRLWIALDGTSYHGGSTRVDEGDRSISLNNSRLGVTVSLPVSRYAIKLAYSWGVTVRAGGDFRAATVAWQMGWLSPRWSGR